MGVRGSTGWQTGRVRVSLLQLASSTDVVENLDVIGTLARQAAVGRTDDDAGLLLAPEAAMHDFGPADRPLGPIAQPLDGPFVRGLGAIARATGCLVGAGMFERSPDPDRPFHAYVVVGPDGDVAAVYRKTHLFDAFGYRESDRLSRGAGAPVVLDCGELHVGLMTCYDLRFPELALDLVEAGADALAVPAAWVAGPHKEDHWRTLLRARAIENTAYVAAPAQCGRTYVGASMVVDPMGVVVAAAGDGPGVVTATLSREIVDRVRLQNPSLANRWERRDAGR